MQLYTQLQNTHQTYLLADLESGSLRSSAAGESLSFTAANLGDPTNRVGESFREGDMATILLASSSHSCVSLLLLFLLTSSSSLSTPPLVKLYALCSVFAVPKNQSFIRSVMSGTGSAGSGCLGLRFSTSFVCMVTAGLPSCMNKEGESLVVTVYVLCCSLESRIHASKI